MARAPMKLLVLCHDAPAAPEARKRLFAEHAAYIEPIIDRLWLAAVLADRDGVALHDYDELRGSLFIVDASIEDARRLVECDPYFRGGVWECVHLLLADHPHGSWLTGAGQEASQRLYLALGNSGSGGEFACFASALSPVLSLGEASARPLWSHASIFSSADLQEASKQANKLPRNDMALYNIPAYAGVAVRDSDRSEA